MGSLFIRLIGRSIRIIDPNRFILRELKRQHGRVIFVLNHGQLFLGTFLAKDENVATIISQHRDGEYIFQIACRLGIKAVRGSSTRGGTAALFELVTSPRYSRDNIGITPDGPRGPIGSVKCGVVLLAKMMGAPIVPVSIASSSYWEFKSWDRFRLPKPFSVALLLLGRPIMVGRKAGPGEIEEKRQELERDMRELNERSEERMELSRKGNKVRFVPRDIGSSIRNAGLRYVNRESERWRSLPLTALLYPLGSLFYSLTRIRDHLYLNGFVKMKSLPVPVISVGNISVGGTGKTMMVRLLAGLLAKRGYRPAILTRGYGGSKAQDVEVISSIEDTRDASIAWGDEPVYLARELPDCVVIRGKNRFLAGLKAVAHHGCDVCILDDGFQFRRLNRDIDIVMLHGERPFGRGWLLPAGNLREKSESIKRADLLVECMRWGGSANGGPLERETFRSVPRIKMSLRADTIYPLEMKGASVDGQELEGKRILAFAGIGDPRSFQYLIETFFPSSVQYLFFHDHHPYTRHSTERIRKLFDRIGADVMVTTEKDAVKLKAEYFGERPCWVVSSRLVIDEGLETIEELLSMLSVRRERGPVDPYLAKDN
jgi:tetraacyldisaccharide 4'-kinase